MGQVNIRRVVQSTAMLALVAGTPLAFGQDAAPRERGLSRFASCTPLAVTGLPECVRAPVYSEPTSQGPLVYAEAGETYAACYDKDNPPSWQIQQAVDQAMRGFMDRYQQNGGRWNGADNTPIAITWSFVPDGLNIPTASGVGDPAAPSELFSRMDSLFAAQGGRATWIAQFQACFDRWAQISGMSYTRVTAAGVDWDDGAAFPGSANSATRGHVRISMKNIDGLNGILAYNFFPQTGDMVIDRSENWAQGSPTYLFLGNVLKHEHGHGLGFNHVCPATGTKLMEPFVSTAYNGPQQDDFRAVHRKYGDTYESNNTVGAATPIAGSLTVGATLNPSTVTGPAVVNTSLTAISIDGDVDYFSVNVPAPILATITVAPVGTTYADLAQTAGCNEAAPTTPALIQSNLAVDVRTQSDVVLYSASAANIGLNETISTRLLSGTGNIIRVFETDTPTQSQQYTLTVTGVSTPTITATDGTLADRVSVSWTAIPDAASYNVFRNIANNFGTATNIGSSATTALDDFSAVPGQVYNYWVVAVINGQSLLAAGPDTGFRSNTGPANNACASATNVSAGGVFNGTLVGATNDGSATCGSATTGPDVWYTFTAGTCPGILTVSTCGTHDAGGLDTGMDTVVSVYASCGGTELACNDDANGACGGADAGSLLRDSLVNVPLTGGQTVVIRVAAFNNGAGGPFILNVNFAIANDLCANATTIAAGAVVNFCNVGANTDGPIEAACNNAGDNNINGDLWYRYTPSQSGRYTVRTCGSTFDTKLGIYPNACPGATGTILVCNDDTGVCSGGTGVESTVSTVGAAGVPQLIRVGGFGANRGNGVLRVFCAADFNLSGSVSVQDLFDFLAAWFSGDPAADINGANGISVQDIFDFLAAWFGGC